MALSLLAKLKNKYFQQFLRMWGRQPETRKEWLTIQDNAVRELNATKGVTGVKKPWHQGWKPQVIQGGKGIESLLKSGDVKIGVAPKTTRETLKAKKDKHILLRDSEEGIARIKRENKQAVEDFKKKFIKTENTYLEELDKKIMDEMELTRAELDNMSSSALDDLRRNADPLGMEKHFTEESSWRGKGDFPDDPLKDPDYASGGRIGMAGGGALWKFIEGLFIQASNDIRLGRGLFKGLTEKQRIVQHDNLTNMVAQWQKTKTLPEGAEQYFGVDAKKAFAAASKKVKKPYRESKLAETVSQEHPSRKGEWEVEMGDREIDWDHLIRKKKIKARKAEVEAQRQEQIMEEAYEEIRGGSGFTGDDLKYDADILAESLATVQGKDYAALGAKEVSDLYGQAYKRVSQDFLKRREAKKALKDVEQKIELQMFDTKGRRPNAYGGIARAGFPFGGKALKAIRDAWRANKTWGVGGPPYKPEKTSFDIKNLTKQTLGQEFSLADLREISKSPLNEKKVTFDQFNREFKNIKAKVLKHKLEESKLQAEAMIESAEMVPADTAIAKKIHAQFTREGKKQLEEANEGLKAIDIYMGMLQKQGRSLHQSGGLAYMLGEPTYMKYGGGGDVGHAPWLKPSGHAQPTPHMDTPTPNVASRPDPLKAPRGIPSVAPKNMDPAYIQQQMIQKAMMGRGPGMMGQGPRTMANAGGRIGF